MTTFVGACVCVRARARACVCVCVSPRACSDFKLWTSLQIFITLYLIFLPFQIRTLLSTIIYSKAKRVKYFINKNNSTLILKKNIRTSIY